jgi:hypothetical protein
METSSKGSARSSSENPDGVLALNDYAWANAASLCLLHPSFVMTSRRARVTSLGSRYLPLPPCTRRPAIADDCGFCYQYLEVRHRAIHDRAHPAGQPRALTRHEDVGSVECRAGARFALELRQRLSTFSINSRNSAIVALRFAGSAGERRLGLVLVLSTSRMAKKSKRWQNRWSDRASSLSGVRQPPRDMRLPSVIVTKSA